MWTQVFENEVTTGEAGVACGYAAPPLKSMRDNVLYMIPIQCIVIYGIGWNKNGLTIRV